MIILTGTVAWDYIMEFPGKFGDHILPEHIHNVNLSFIVNKFAKRRGGTAGNVSYTMGLLQTPHTLFTHAGKDFDEYKKDFQKLKINVSHIVIDTKEHTATGFAMTDKTNNQIWGYYYGAANNNEKLQLKDVAKKGDLVLIGPQGAKGSMHFIDECIRQKISYMFDPGFILTDVSNADLENGLKNATYIIGNEYEFELMQKRIKTWEKSTQGKILITTMGEKGATIQHANQAIHIKSVLVAKVSSTTGAGDAWRGGFLAGLQRGFDLKTSGQMGSLASSYAVSHYGTQEHTFTKKQFQERYRQSFGSLLHL